jgi:NAD(P)-dependent dehydrogenase (short-subunit alcohol dehydrogenase family)
MRVLITGISRGIGYGLAKYYLQRGDEVIGLGRSNPFGEIEFYKVDMRAFEKLSKIASRIKNIDLAILNAGVLGEIKELKEWSIKELEDVFDVNVWANKILIDELDAKKIVAISSGAGVNGNKGWGGYSLSKCALNMMVKIYAKEIDKKIYALAPGVIETEMVKKVISVDKNKFPSVKRVEAGMVDLEKGIERIVKAIERLDEFESGSFVDVREL